MTNPALGPRVGRWLIYGLVDPRNGTLFYIGKTHRRRELRLAEHIEEALAGGVQKRHAVLRDILGTGSVPLCIVLKRLPSDHNWRTAEQDEIRTWEQLPPSSFPCVHPPQTRLSQPVTIHSVNLTN